MQHSFFSRSPELFRETLYSWHAGIHRPMPWVGEKDPYRIWVSEVILQQTRVDQGLSYYHRFLDAFPDLEHLAAASEEHLFKVWEGLGYYSRARNMQFTARQLVAQQGGKFPTTYEGLLELKGIGPYTAAAIASFAFALPQVVVDGNVLRIISRIWGISDSMDAAPGKRRVHEVATGILDMRQPGRFNQALMDFGAVQCVPQRPDCSVCPFSDQCAAFSSNMVAALPSKKGKTARRNRYFHYLLPIHEGNTWVRQRPVGDIWAGLYEFPMLETAGMELDTLQWNTLDWMDADSGCQPHSPSPVFRQTLSHQQVFARFWKMELSMIPTSATEEWERIPLSELTTRPFPRLIRWYIDTLAAPGLLF